MSKIANERYKDSAARKKVGDGVKNSKLWRSVISSQEYKKSVSEGHLNPDSQFQKTMKSKEFSETCKQSKIGKLNPAYGKTKENSYHWNKGKEIYKFSLDGILIKKYENSIRAEEDNPGTDRSTIMGRCNGRKNKHYRGYLYSFAKEKKGYFKSLEEKNGTYIIIDNDNNKFQFNRKTEIIKHFKLSRFSIKIYLNKI